MTSNTRTLMLDDLATLRWATEHLERPSLAARLTSVVGTPIELAVKLLPRPLCRRIHRIADQAIARVLVSAVVTLPGRAGSDLRLGYYRGLVAASRALGGIFCLLRLAQEMAHGRLLFMDTRRPQQRSYSPLRRKKDEMFLVLVKLQRTEAVD